MYNTRLLIIVFCIVLVAACTQSDQQVQTVQSAAAALALIGTSWQVEEIDGGAVVDASQITLLFPEENKVVGSAGCNRYFGTVAVDGNTISFGNAGTTMMACPEPLMKQEQQFFAALSSIRNGEVDAESRLLLSDDTGTTRLQASEYVPAEAEATADTAPPEPLDQASTEGFSFDCGKAGTADVRFLGPDTVELSLAGETYIMPRERTASGAKYVGDGASFWNKGDEALIEIGEERFSCTRN